MRWEALFADLESQLEAAGDLDHELEIRDRERREAALVRLVDRLAGSVGGQVNVQVSGSVIKGELRAVGVDWLLLGTAPSRESLVPLEAVLTVAGLSRLSRSPGSEGAVGAKLRLGYALRLLARDRAGVTVVLRDGSQVTGTLDRVGSDFVEVAEHPAGEPRRVGAVFGLRAVPYAAISVVRST